MIANFLSDYGTTILYTIITAIVGFIGLLIKQVLTKYMNEDTKRKVVRTCVQAVEQLYKDLHGDDKYEKVAQSVKDMLTVKGIAITDLELKMLIEAAVAEFNDVFNLTDETKTADEDTAEES